MGFLLSPPARLPSLQAPVPSAFLLYAAGVRAPRLSGPLPVPQVTRPPSRLGMTHLGRPRHRRPPPPQPQRTHHRPGPAPTPAPLRPAQSGSELGRRKTRQVGPRDWGQEWNHPDSSWISCWERDIHLEGTSDPWGLETGAVSAPKPLGQAEPDAVIGHLRPNCSHLSLLPAASVSSCDNTTPQMPNPASSAGSRDHHI